MKELRKRAHLSQEDVATRLGSKQASISEWESEKKTPSLETAIQLSRIFGVSIDCVVGLAPIPEGYPDHIAPVPYNEVIRSVSVAAECPREFKPTKKPPFTQEQTAYLEALEDRIVEKVAATLKEDTSLLKEAGSQGK